VLTEPRLLAATGLVTLYLAMCLAIALRERGRQQRAAEEAHALAASHEAAWLVVHASQTGSAEQIAWQTARALHAAGVPAQLLSMATLTPDALRRATHALFIVSTYGEGDPPDAATPFARAHMNHTALDLSSLQVGVLALGDRSYAHFCGFGRALDAWLTGCGALPLFERIEADQVDATALREWQHQLGHVASIRDLDDWQAPAFAPWRLAARRHLNPGSQGAPVFHVELEPADAPLTPEAWQAGDLAQLRLPDDPAHPREYSIASLPSDGRLHLLARQHRRDDGTLGLASGWLTDRATVGDVIELRLRAHSNFRLGDNLRRPLILIGNGTGLAGLRAHLKARAQHDVPTRNWLIFGERQAAHDAYCADEIAEWKAQGVLERADLVYSRDGGPTRYVQDRVREAGHTLKLWLADGAAVYVCGSLEGMAAGVDDALVQLIGQDGVDQLVAEGRYRRDVY
jgi:sulfite reductase (NADPH) flavoprotein alpha-component